MDMSPKQPHTAEKSLECGVREDAPRQKTLSKEMFTLQLEESKRIIFVIFCPGAQDVKYIPLAQCVFFMGRYVGAVFQVIWGSVSLECILKPACPEESWQETFWRLYVFWERAGPWVLQSLVQIVVFRSVSFLGVRCL